MNHIYKSIFNKALGVFTAVPEFASAHGKGSERTVVGRVAKGTAGFAASALAISIGLALTSTSAVGYPGIYINDRQAGNCTAINDSAIPNLGVGTILDVNSTPGSVVLRVPGTSTAPAGVTPSHYNAAGSARPCEAIGNSTVNNRETQTNRTLFYGGPGAATEADEVNNENNGAKNLTLGGRLDVNSGIIGVGDRGVNGLDATNSIRMGMGTALSDDNKKTDAVTIGVNAGASAKHATAIGSATTAKTGYSTALGFQSQAGDPAVTNFNGEYATAIGGKAKALHAYTTALGAETNASGAYATAVGNEAKATHESTTAVGKGAKATNDFATAVGQLALASGKNGTAVGTRNEALGEEATALGYHSHANGSQQLSIGAHAGRNLDGSFSQSTHGISIGSLAGADNATAKSNDDSVLIGTESGRYAQGGDRNTSIGKSAGQYLKGNDNIAMGSNAGSGTATDKLEVSNTVAIGNTAKASGNDGIALGNTANSKTDGAISIGTRSVSGDGDAVPGVTPIGNKSISIGYESVANRYDTIAMGVESSTQAADPAVAPWDAVAIGSKSKATTYKALAIGAYSQATGRQSTVIGNDIQGQNSTASGTRSQILGVQSNVSGDNSVSIGDTNTVASARTYAMGNNINAAAGTDDSLAFGTKAGVGGANAIALGNTAKATKENTIAQGTESVVYGKNSVSIGYKAVSGIETPTPTQTNAFSVSIGNETEAIDASTIAIGDKAKAKGGVDALAVGTQANAMTYKALAIGAYSQATGRQSTVIGNDIQGQPSIASGTRSQIIGVQSNVSGDNSVSIGDTNTIASARTYAIGNNINVVANTDDSLVFGTRAHTDFSRSIAMGVNASTQGQTGVAIGDNAVTNGVNQISIGHKAGDVTETDNKKTRRPNLGNFGVMIGHYAGAEYTADEVTPVNHQHGTVAVGTQAGRAGKDSWSNIALGNQAGRAVHGNDNIAIGVNSGSGKMTDKVESDGKDVSTVDEYLNVKHSISVGTMSTAKNNYSIAIGTVASAGNGQKEADGSTKNGYSVAIGTSASASALNSVALGAAASASHEYSVALGRDSKTSDVHTGAYTLNTSYTAAGLPVAANGTVSVGSAGKERQIQNVAAGVISATSTDAINGSQLYATNNYMNNFAGDVKTKLGGNAALGNDGHLTMTNIGGTGKDNVNDAIAAANTKVAAGENITVTPTTNADGSKTYTVATTKDLVVNSVKAGDTTVNTDGVTIANGPSVTKTGINAGDKKITGVANGNVAAGSTDAVNGGQLAEVKSKADSAVQNVVSANPTALTATKAGDTVTLTPNFIAGDLVNADGTVKDPAAADEGKLVSAKTVADALKANHFVVDTKANGGKVDAASEENAKVGSGNKVTFEAGKNLVAQQTNTANGGATVNYKLSDTLENLVSVKSAEIEAGIGPNKVVLNNNGVKVGDSTLNDKGLTINNGPSVTDTGIDAGNKKITGVADGNVAAGSTDAVNGGQLAAVKAKADTAVQDIKSGDEKALSVTKAGNTYTITPNLSGDLVDANGNITAPTTPADKGKLVTAGTVAEALANTHFVVDTKATDGELDAASQADQKIKASNKVTLQAGKNLKAKQTNGANGAEVEFSLKDSISLKEVKVGEGSANEVVLNNNGVNVAGNTYINKDGLNANDKKITNVAPGAVTPTSKDAVNGGQLYDVAKNVADLVGPDAKIDPATGKVSVADPAQGIGGTGKDNIGDAIKAVNATAAKHTTVVEGKNVKVTKGKNAAGGDEYTVATKDDLEVTSVTAGNTTVNTNGLTITGGPSVTRGGIDAGNRIISGVKAGDVSATSQEAVNGSQLHATNTKLDGVKAKADTAVQDVKSGDENALTAVKDPNTNIVTVTPKLSGNLVDADGNITAPTTPADKGKLVTAGTVADALANTHFVVDTKATDGELDAASQADQKIKAGNKVTLQAGKNLKAKQTNGANGAQVEFSLKDSISLKEVTAGEGANQVVLGNDGVKVGGNTYINNAGLNANGNKITNVADGVDPTDAVNKSQLDAVKGVADSAVKSVDVANGEQNLVVDNTDPKNPKLSLKKDLTVDSVKAGDSTLNNDGLTIAGGPSVKKDGINAGDKTITNVAPGAVTPTSKDAVNGGQLYNVANNVKDLIGPDATIDPATGKVTVADPAKGIGETGKGNIGDAIKHVNDAAKAAADTAKKHTTVEQGDNIVVEESLNADGGKHYKVSTAKDLNVDSVKAGDTTVNNDGVTIAGGPSVTKAGINAGGNTITNVADGVNPTDAVNKGQLDKVAGVADSAVKSVDVANGEQNLVVDNSDPKNPKLSLKKDLTVDSVKAGDSTLNNDGLTIAGGPSVKKDGIDAGDKKITNVAAGDVAENSKDAVNGGQLYDVAKNVADLVGPDAKIDPATGKVTVADPAKGIGETGKGNIGDAIKHVNDLAKNAADTAKKHTTVEQGDNIVVEESTNAEGGKHYKVSTAKNLNVDSVKAGDTTVNNDGVTIAGGPSVTKGGINAGGNTITNVADGVNPNDAVNKGQLDKVDTKVSNVAQNVVNVLGGDAAVNGNGDITMSNIGETGKGNINDAIKSVNDLAKKAAAEKTSVKAKEGRSNVTVTEGVNAAGGHEYTVDVERSVTNAGSDYVTVTNNHDADSNTTTYTVDVSAKTKASLAKADSAVQGLTSKDGNLNFTKGANGNVEVSFNDNLNVKNVTTDRVQVANGPSMSKDGINAAGKAISNVANGNVAADSKDAVNGGQLHETAKSVADVIGGGATVKDGKVVAGQNGIGNTGQNTVHGAIAAINQNTANNFNQIRGDLRKMDRDLRGGIAGALATAGLPQAFRPGKSMVAAAASTYRGQSGLAIGVSRISDNGKVILKVTGNTNSRGDFGGTIGAGYQW